MGSLKDFVKAMMKRCGIGLVSYGTLQKLFEVNRAGKEIDLLLHLKLPNDEYGWPLKVLGNSKAAFRQDLFVLSELGFKRDGYFVEFGATNGVDSSNTYLLEKEFGWRGILAEPAKCWHEALRANRECHIETDCVWRHSGQVLAFSEQDNGEFSTIDSYRSVDIHRKLRRQGKKYDVVTISLEDLLDKYGAPQKIDYLSIDTEGSEFEILSSLTFKKYQFRIITCEHNFTPAREKIVSLLSRNGYVRTLAEFSRYDDWFVKID